MATNYPQALDNSTSLPYPTATSATNSPSLSGGQDNQNDAVIAVQTLLGTNSSQTSPSGSNYVLQAVSTTANTWGLLTAANTATLSGSGAFVFGNSPTINSPNLISPNIANVTFTGSLGAINTSTITASGLISANGGLIASGTITLPSGSIIPNNLVSGTGSSWTWQSWTPTWTNLTVGNGTVTATYIQIGATVFFNVDVIFGSSSSMGTTPEFTLPVTSVAITNSFYHSLGDGAVSLAYEGDINYLIEALAYSTTQGRLYTSTAAGETTGITSTAPFTWTTGSVITFSGMYQAA